MADEYTIPVAYTEREDGTWLCASIKSAPWFCVSAESEDAVRDKAQRALNFWAANRDAPLPSNLERIVAPFAAKRTDSLRAPAELCD